MHYLNAADSVVEFRKPVPKNRLSPQFSNFLQLFGIKQIPNIQKDKVALFLAYYPLNILGADAGKHLRRGLNFLFLYGNHSGNTIDNDAKFHSVNVNNDKT
jgi:hypothetical protein